MNNGTATRGVWSIDIAFFGQVSPVRPSREWFFLEEGLCFYSTPGPVFRLRPVFRFAEGLDKAYAADLVPADSRGRA